MKIGIHYTKGYFSERWIAYCESKGIAYKLVDCYQSDIIEQLSDCDALMWHFNHKSPKASKFAKQLLFSIEASGKKVFPDYNTVWHFDDKLGQKYLLEALDVPMVPTYAFYSKKEAIAWASGVSYPKVFKLRGGSSSDNVKLVKSLKGATRLIKKAFGRGFNPHERLVDLKERFRKYRIGQTSTWGLIKGVIRLFWATEYAKVTGREKGYVYFQDFIPENEYDIRVIVVGDKAFAIKRMVRKNDFRASGSGFISYEKENFDDEVIQMSFDISEMLHAQCMTYDFVFLKGKALVVEISYGFHMYAYDDCVGYWEKDMNWFEGKFDPYAWMVEDLMDSIEQRKV